MRPIVFLTTVVLFALLNAYPLYMRVSVHGASKNRLPKNLAKPSGSVRGGGGGAATVFAVVPTKWKATSTTSSNNGSSSSSGGGGGSGSDPARLVFPMRASSDQLSGPQLLRGYSADRPDRVCDPLPANVTIKLEDDVQLGTILDVYRGGGPAESRRAATKAYVLMVSNHKYVDGALVMGDSLRSTSKFVQDGTAKLIILVNEKINNASLRQLAVVFDVVKVMRTVGRFSPKSYYKTTFDKMYLFWLTEFERVVFFDADSLALGNTDHLFAKLPEKSDMFLTAVGGSSYFQTALLVVKPDRRIFTDIYLEYRFGAFGYDQWRARDGILLRECFLKRHKNIDHPKEIHHFYGYVKPWFNKDVKHKRAKDKLDFDEFYVKWWTRYERLHTEHFVAMAEEERRRNPAFVYGNSALNIKTFGLPPPRIPAAAVDPAKYMWLQRFSVGSEYLRPTFAHYDELRDSRPDGLRVLVANSSGLSCDAVCSGAGLACRDDTLQLSAVNSCAALKTLTHCSECTLVSISAAAPLVFPANSARRRCQSNFLHEPTTLPLCNATWPGSERRVCGCL